MKPPVVHVYDIREPDVELDPGDVFAVVETDDIGDVMVLPESWSARWFQWSHEEEVFHWHIYVERPLGVVTGTVPWPKGDAWDFLL